MALEVTDNGDFSRSSKNGLWLQGDFEGNRLQVSPGYSSMVKVSLPANYQGIITIDFVPPIFWRICEIISLISMIAIVIITRLEKMNRRPAMKSQP